MVPRACINGCQSDSKRLEALGWSPAAVVVESPGEGCEGFPAAVDATVDPRDRGEDGGDECVEQHDGDAADDLLRAPRRRSADGLDVRVSCVSQRRESAC